MKSTAIVILAALALAACDGKPVAESQPAVGEELADYSRNISRSVSLGGDGPLVQRFCKNALGAVCPADIATLLSEYGYTDGGTGVDLANAFVVMAADKKDGTPDKTSSDEDYVDAAYRVAVAREPGGGGSIDNLNFIKNGGNRKAMLRSMLQSDEFKRLS